jgi:hypothetical protein
MNLTEHERVDARTIAWLGYGGLLPFAGLAVLVSLEPSRAAFWSLALIAYGAVILSFVGALHWAFAMLLPGLSAGQRRYRYVWSTAPALVGWIGLLLPPITGSIVLMLGFIAHLLHDRHLVQHTTLPVWYWPLRLRLTLGACLALGAGAMGLVI